MAKRFVKAWLLAAYVTAEHNELLLARAATIDVFFKNATAPNTWTVRSREDIDGPHTDIYNKSKHVYRAHVQGKRVVVKSCLLYTSPSPRDATLSRMPSSA